MEGIVAHRLSRRPTCRLAGAGGRRECCDALDRSARSRRRRSSCTGTEDNVVDARNARLLAERIPGAGLELLEGAGHMLFWERADEFVGIVEDFLR